jgi:hypothetical protein
VERAHGAFSTFRVFVSSAICGLIFAVSASIAHGANDVVAVHVAGFRDIMGIGALRITA